MTTLADINTADRQRFVQWLGGVFENSAWVAERAFRNRPFTSVSDLHSVMFDTVLAASPDEQLALIRAHPELAGREAIQGAMTVESTGEQGRLGLTALPRAEYERISELNRAYREKFDFPCIVALNQHATRDTVFAQMAQRLANDSDIEIANALTQIGHITRARLEKLLGGY